MMGIFSMSQRDKLSLTLSWTEDGTQARQVCVTRSAGRVVLELTPAATHQANEHPPRLPRGMLSLPPAFARIVGRHLILVADELEPNPPDGCPSS
jgi:hypothetical protein